MVCSNLREISRSFLRDSSRLRIFVRGVNAKKELFSWADLSVLRKPVSTAENMIPGSFAFKNLSHFGARCILTQGFAITYETNR